ncbi:peptidoglycan glycosyltransferase [Enterococcus alcedinis]|uniref:Peptidoglycan glycosyltransferase n=1 Tax=Enterococcus alcedinis TaxID=1274384 RepID=A0A917N4A0_9ENTE|nr:PBP1A family penicillin-binding protein [Enterococcus alcedinis]MBP2100853.1 penicillin-binding protein 1A [Enterococcus alcedinis]GGI64849.1 peptidoglycan glycosyltransferase [Enterococcus alcedinis]
MSNESGSRATRHNKPTGTKKKKPQKKKKTFGSVFLKILLGFVFAGCLLFLGGVGLFWSYASNAPELDEKRLESANSSKLFAQNGEVFQEIGTEKRETITATEIPKLLEDAIVSVEDRRFYQHIGVDPIRIVGSALSNAKTGGIQGGSTLTQQLIKLSFFSTAASDQTLKRKAQEAWMAVQLEKEKSKQEILTYYINKVYMSNGLYGMQTASKAFYDKTLDELTLAETALIAGLPNAPSYFDPYANPENAKERRDIVLFTMKDNGKITDKEYQEAINTPIDAGLKKLNSGSNTWKYYDNYIKEVIDEVERKTGVNVYTDGVEIHTNIDLEAQRRLYDIVNTDQYIAYPDGQMQVAATLIDTETGKVTAQIGGRNIEEGAMLGENLATNTRRDLGSTVKPITDYGPAFEFEKFSTAKTIVDEPYNYKGTNIPVMNWDNRYMGTMTLRQALVESRNVPAAKLFEEVGADNVADFLGRLNIRYEVIEQANSISSNTSVQDGTKYGISSLKLAAAYAAFANGGTYYEPQYVNKIVFEDGSEEVEAFKTTGKKAMEETTAYMITDILKGVITSGTGSNAMINGLYQAGKTGTSNYSKEDIARINSPYTVVPDSSFAGYTKAYSLAVWTGYKDQKTPIVGDNTSIASDVYRELMQFVSASVVNSDWEMPKGLSRIGNELYFEGQYVKPVAPSKPKETTTKTSSTESSTTVESTQSSESSTSSSQSTEKPVVPPVESSSEAPIVPPTTPPTVPPTSSSVVPPVEEIPPVEETPPTT